MKSWLSQRRYPQKLIEAETSKVTYSGQRVSHGEKVGKGVPLVVNTTPSLNLLAKLFMMTYIYYR